VAVLLAASLAAAAPPARAATSPAGYLAAAQNSDGGLGAAPASASSQLFSGWAALAFAADGQKPQLVRHGGQSLIGYIGASLASASDVGSIERTILVVRAAGLSATDFNGHNLVATLLAHVRRNGSVGGLVNLTSFAVLALRAAGHSIAPATRSWLVRQQDPDGGYNFAAAGGSSDIDDTGAALEALAAAGHTPARARDRAVAFIRAQQDRDGGFPSNPGGDSNAQSTAWAVQGLIAVGVNPGSLHRRGAPSPLQFLRSLTAADGHIRYSRASDQTPVWTTAQAAMALAERALPFAPVPIPVARHPVAPRHRTHAAAAPAARRVARAPSSHGQTIQRGAGGRVEAAPLSLDWLAADAALMIAVVAQAVRQW
jgi:prenyltransferase beta subunit